MALRLVKTLTRFLLLLNLCMFFYCGCYCRMGSQQRPRPHLLYWYLLLVCIICFCAFIPWSVLLIDSMTNLQVGKTLHVGFYPVYFPMGNEATGFKVIFSLIATIVGTALCLSGLHHLWVWTAHSLASSILHDSLGPHSTRHGVYI